VNWQWTARRLAISAFLVVHITATLIWVSPPCELRNRFQPIVRYYIMPLGVWQYWTMFSPDPVRDAVTVEAELTDCKGIRHSFAFPRLADYSMLDGIPRFRFSKYAANLSDGEFAIPRKCAARHAARALKLAPEQFPVEVHLVYQCRLAPNPGEPAGDPMTPTKPVVIGHFEFASRSEVYP
jgi:hypothetical protein